MINGLNVGTPPRATQGNGSNSGAKNTGARKNDNADFADQLLGTKPAAEENQNRNDRKKISGRDSNREEKRSNDRENDSKSASVKLEKKAIEPRRHVRLVLNMRRS
ncbi:MAG: hypothetical protein EOP05_13775 [Proteobacteria bacterium]|nr:MAG: hypothetical protein EOP05_13775 [Pseudomonadota bacterium]